jgi:hypothetical protein
MKKRIYQMQTFENRSWIDLHDETIKSVEADIYGSYVDLKTESGRSFRISSGRSNIHNESWSTVKLMEKLDENV